MDLRARGRENEGIEIHESKLLKSAGGNRSYSQGQAGKKKKKTGREQSKTPAYARANKTTSMRSTDSLAQMGKGAWLT